MTAYPKCYRRCRKPVSLILPWPPGGFTHVQVVSAGQSWPCNQHIIAGTPQCQARDPRKAKRNAPPPELLLLLRFAISCGLYAVRLERHLSLEALGPSYFCHDIERTPACPTILHCNCWTLLQGRAVNANPPCFQQPHAVPPLALPNGDLQIR